MDDKEFRRRFTEFERLIGERGQTNLAAGLNPGTYVAGFLARIFDPDDVRLLDWATRRDSLPDARTGQLVMVTDAALVLVGYEGIRDQPRPGSSEMGGLTVSSRRRTDVVAVQAAFDEIHPDVGGTLEVGAMVLTFAGDDRLTPSLKLPLARHSQSSGTDYFTDFWAAIFE